MAHGDYSCCAVCDSKMEYGGERTKEDICTSCAVDLAKGGVFVKDSGELLAWMKSEKPNVVVSTLIGVGFKQCFYGNEIDRQFMAIKAPADKGTPT